MSTQPYTPAQRHHDKQPYTPLNEDAINPPDGRRARVRQIIQSLHDPGVPRLADDIREAHAQIAWLFAQKPLPHITPRDRFLDPRGGLRRREHRAETHRRVTEYNRIIDGLNRTMANFYTVSYGKLEADVDKIIRLVRDPDFTTKTERAPTFLHRTASIDRVATRLYRTPDIRSTA